jgi:hypothetical protein
VDPGYDHLVHLPLDAITKDNDKIGYWLVTIEHLKALPRTDEVRLLAMKLALKVGTK